MKNFFIKVHQILGSVLSLVFLVWFLSGFVMIYSGFPRPNKEHAFEQLETLKPYLSEIKLPKNEALQDITLEVINGTPVYTSISTSFYSPNAKTINARSLALIQHFPEKKLDSMVMAQYQSNIAKKTILTNFDTWIPWADFKAYFPIHKYYLDDEAKTEVYVASTTGKIVQESTSKQRWFAYFGAIPHWFYFKSLRLHQDVWAKFLIWLSGLGTIMCLSGLIVGFYRSRKWRVLKKKGLLHFSTYKERWYKWHHILGMTFGLFVFTFVFSGMLSLQDVPQWILPLDEEPDYRKIWNDPAAELRSFKLPISEVLQDERFCNTKQIQWKQIGDKPYYFLYQKYQQPTIISADRTDSVCLKTFSYEDLAELVAKKFHAHTYTISNLKTSDYYYTPEKNSVAKVVFEDNNKTWAYIDATNPIKLHTINKSERVSRWLYKGLHTFKFPVLKEIDWLRKLLLIVVIIFGTIISFTGVVLSYKYFIRLKKKRKRRASVRIRKLHIKR